MNKFVVVQNVTWEGNFGTASTEKIVDPILFRGNLGELREFSKHRKLLILKLFAAFLILGKLLSFIRCMIGLKLFARINNFTNHNMNDYIAIINFGTEYKIQPVKGESSKVVTEKLTEWLNNRRFPFTNLQVYTYEQWFALEGREF